MEQIVKAMSSSFPLWTFRRKNDRKIASFNESSFIRNVLPNQE